MHYTETNHHDSQPVNSYIQAGNGAVVNQINEGPLGSTNQGDRTRSVTNKPMTRLEYAEWKNQETKFRLNMMVGFFARLDREFKILRESMNLLKAEINAMNKNL